jgi:drug/metabolite transporter (DMT)-like permease
MSKRSAWGFLFCVAFLWGSTFLVIQDSLHHIGPLGFVGVRFLVGALAVLVFALKKPFTLNSRELRLAVVSGLCLGGGYFLQTVGLQYTTTGKAAFITGATIVFVPLIELILVRRFPTNKEKFALLLAFVGLVLLTWKPGEAFTRGDLLVLGSAVLFALQIICLSVSRSSEPIQFTLVQLVVVAVPSLAISLLWEGMSFSLPLKVWGALAYTGLLATALAFFLQTRAQQIVPAAWGVLILGLEPVIASLLGWGLAGESMNGQELFGCILLLIATSCPGARFWWRKKPRHKLSKL